MRKGAEPSMFVAHADVKILVSPSGDLDQPF